MNWKEAGTITVAVHTLKELLDAIPEGKTITWLKTDMQGYDFTGIKSAGEAIKRVKKISSEVYKDGFPSYKGVHNELNKDWMPYMTKMGFKNTLCGDVFVKEKEGYHELDC